MNNQRVQFSSNKPYVDKIDQVTKASWNPKQYQGQYKKNKKGERC
jgi:hypothetical protein